jgi:hypothetical protein
MPPWCISIIIYRMLCVWVAALTATPDGGRGITVVPAWPRVGEICPPSATRGPVLTYTHYVDRRVYATSDLHFMIRLPIKNKSITNPFFPGTMAEEHIHEILLEPTYN